MRKNSQAAEAFVNFVSRPDNAVRNMYYIGYTSVISGGDDDTVYDYLKWNYEAEDDEEDTTEYPVGFFFCGDDSNEDYIMTVPEEQTRRQLFAQYPTRYCTGVQSCSILMIRRIRKSIRCGSMSGVIILRMCRYRYGFSLVRPSYL